MMTALGFLGGFFGVKELARDTSFYIDNVAASSYTSSARNIGAASATRRVYALVCGGARNDENRQISAVSIGGISATIHESEINVLGGDSYSVVIASAVVPTGTTAQVQVTISGGNFNGVAIAVIALDDLDSGTPHDTSAADAEITVPETPVDGEGLLDFADSGYAMAIAASSFVNTGNEPDDISVLNMTQSMEETMVVSALETSRFAVFYKKNTPEEVGVDITGTFTNGDAGSENIVVAISVR